MCIVSNISDYYNLDNWMPKRPISWPTAAPPELPWTPDSLKLLKELMEKMKELDAKLGLANCEDPKKAAWMEELEKRVGQLEKQRPRQKRRKVRKA